METIKVILWLLAILGVIASFTLPFLHKGGLEGYLEATFAANKEDEYKEDGKWIRKAMLVLAFDFPRYIILMLPLLIYSFVNQDSSIFLEWNSLLLFLITSPIGALFGYMFTHGDKEKKKIFFLNTFYVTPPSVIMWFVWFIMDKVSKALK